MNLNIGSGLYPPPAGWLNVDFNTPTEDNWLGWPWSPNDPNPGVQWQIDIVADCRELPVADDSVDHIFFGHMLEHLDYLTDAHIALIEAWRVLKVGGEIGVVGPAMDYALDQNCSEDLLGDIGHIRSAKWDAADKIPGMAHLWEATSVNTLELVQLVFSNAVIVPVTDVAPPEWPCTNAGLATWQVAIKGSKQ